MQKDQSDSHTLREVRYDASGDFEVYRKHVARTMEKPYPDNSGFYGMGCLREMGLRRSKHIGDWRTHSTFANKEEEFRQPLRGQDTILERGLTIRSSGGVRTPGSAVGESAGAYEEPQQHRATVRQNLQMIRTFGESLSLPKEVAERRLFEQELAALNKPDAAPLWPLKFAYKLFRTYDVPFPLYHRTSNTRAAVSGMSDSLPPSTAGSSPLSASRRSSVDSPRHSGLASPLGASSPAGRIAPYGGEEDGSAGGTMLPRLTASRGDGGAGDRGPGPGGSSRASSASLPPIGGGGRGGAGRKVGTALALRVEVIRGDDLPKMDAVAVNSSVEGCDPFVVLRYGGLEVARTGVLEGTYCPEWNEEFLIPIAKLSQNDPLVLQVWDEDDERGELIGQDCVNFASLILRQRQERWYTITAEGPKAKQSVDLKAESTHAGRVLIGLTLGFAHELAEEKAARDAEARVGEEDREHDTQTEGPWGAIMAEDPERDSRLGRRADSNSSVRAMLARSLETVIRGVNVTQRGDLWRSLDLLLAAQKRQLDGRLYDARQCIDQALFYAKRCFCQEFADSENRMLAAKVAMSCLCFVHETGQDKAAGACLEYLSTVVGNAELQRSVDEELRLSDPDNKLERSSLATRCACPKTSKHSQGIRHREVEDVRATLQAAIEELGLGVERVPSLRETGRPRTDHPGPHGRRVDAALELLSCATPLCLKGHHSAVNAVAISRDWLFTASQDQTIRVWNLTTYALVAILDLHHRAGVTGLAVGGGHQGHQLYSASNDGLIKAFDISDAAMAEGKTIRCVKTLRSHEAAVRCVATAWWEPPPGFSEDRVAMWRLYSGSEDRTVQVYECLFIGAPDSGDSTHVIATLRGHRGAVTCVCMGRGRVFTGGMDGTVRAWDVNTHAQLLLTDLDSCLANSLVMASGRLYAATSDRVVLAVDPSSLKVQARLEGHSAYAFCLAGSQSAMRRPMGQLAQTDNPWYDDPLMPGRPLSVQGQDRGAPAVRFSTVTVGVVKALGVEDVSDPFIGITIGGRMVVSGREVQVHPKTARTKVMRGGGGRPRWNETYTFVMPEVYDTRVPGGSSVLGLPMSFVLYSARGAHDEEVRHWSGTLGDILPEPPRKNKKRGQAPRKEELDRTVKDGDDRGIWLFLRPDAQVLGVDKQVYIGMEVGMSEEGIQWLKAKKLDDDSQGKSGIVTEVAKDGSAAKVLWSVTKGKPKDGVGGIWEEGWESKFAYPTGRGGHCVLCEWDEDPQSHGQLMTAISVTPHYVGEELPLEPHRHFLVSGSDDETCKVWDLHSHTCVATLEGQHTNKVSATAFTDANRLITASQDSTVRLW